MYIKGETCLPANCEHSSDSRGITMETICLSGDYPKEDIQSVLQDAVNRQTEMARARLSQFEADCRGFEETYGMTSETFLARFEAGELGDDPDWFDWFAAAKGKRSWEKKLGILQGLKWIP